MDIHNFRCCYMSCNGLSSIDYWCFPSTRLLYQSSWYLDWYLLDFHICNFTWICYIELLFTLRQDSFKISSLRKINFIFLLDIEEKCEQVNSNGILDEIEESVRSIDYLYSHFFLLNYFGDLKFSHCVYDCLI